MVDQWYTRRHLVDNSLSIVLGERIANDEFGYLPYMLKIIDMTAEFSAIFTSIFKIINTKPDNLAV